MTQHHVAVQVPATSANLGAGFDCFGVAVGLHLTAMTADRTEVRVATSGEGEGDLATDDTNLVWHSFVRLHDEVGAAVPDVSLRVRNAVPLERGLGSSSAAIVAGLGLARAMSATSMGDRDLVALATDIEGHPDNVAPAILGGLTASVTGSDGVALTRLARPHARLRPIVLVPTTRQNTQEARGVLPEHLGRADVATQVARGGHVLGGLLGGWPIAPAAAGDVLHEPARLAVMADSGALVEALRAAGVHTWLSGAGPTIATAVPARDSAAHETVTRLATEHGFVTHVLDWDLSGLVTCPPAAVA